MPNDKNMPPIQDLRKRRTLGRGNGHKRPEGGQLKSLLREEKLRIKIQDELKFNIRKRISYLFDPSYSIHNYATLLISLLFKILVSGNRLTLKTMPNKRVTGMHARKLVPDITTSTLSSSPAFWAWDNKSRPHINRQKTTKEK